MDEKIKIINEKLLTRVNKYKFLAILGWSLLIFLGAVNLIVYYFGI